MVYLVHQLRKHPYWRYAEMIKTYGQQQAGKQPSEAAEMTTFFNQLKKRYPEIHALALHVRNEGKRDHKDTNIIKMSDCLQSQYLAHLSQNLPASS